MRIVRREGAAGCIEGWLWDNIDRVLLFNLSAAVSIARLTKPGELGEVDPEASDDLSSRLLGGWFEDGVVPECGGELPDMVGEDKESIAL